MRFLHTFTLANLLVFLLCGTAFAEVVHVNTQQMQALIEKNKDNPDFVILDASPEGAYARAHIEGALPMAVRNPDFETKISKLDKSKTYLIYCMGGRWTSEAFQIMRGNGFTNLIIASEGLSGWMHAGNNVVSNR